MTMMEHMLRELLDFYGRLWPVPGGDVRAFLERYGQLWPWRPRPKGIRQRALKECYNNAWGLALSSRFPGLIYVEGVYEAEIGSHRVPIPHAWNADAEGYVVDATVKEPRGLYFGVALQTSYVSRVTLDRIHVGPCLPELIAGRYPLEEALLGGRG
jgi:hypothetical protein